MDHDASTSGSAVFACLITFPDDETAARVARALVEEGLAACVNLMPGVRSIYHWKGEVSDDRVARLTFQMEGAGDADNEGGEELSKKYTAELREKAKIVKR